MKVRGGAKYQILTSKIVILEPLGSVIFPTLVLILSPSLLSDAYESNVFIFHYRIQQRPLLRRWSETVHHSSQMNSLSGRKHMAYFSEFQ